MLWTMLARLLAMPGSFLFVASPTEPANKFGLADEARHWRRIPGEWPDLARGGDNRLPLPPNQPLPTPSETTSP